MTDEMHMHSYETLTHAGRPAMTAYLFLGGTLDGEILHVQPEQWDVRIIVPKSDLAPVASYGEVVVGEEHYTRQRLAGETEMFEVFTPTDWTGDTLMQHLLLRATKEA